MGEEGEVGRAWHKPRMDCGGTEPVGYPVLSLDSGSSISLIPPSSFHDARMEQGGRGVGD